IWHESQQIAPLPDGGVRMTLRVSVDPALRTWVLGFGADARVVAPRALADAIADECRKILDRRDNPAPSRPVYRSPATKRALAACGDRGATPDAPAKPRPGHTLAGP